MSPKARGLAQQGGPPGWLKESDTEGCDFIRDGRSMAACLDGPHHLSLSGADLFLNVHKTLSSAMSHKEGMIWYSSRPMPFLWLKSLSGQQHLYTREHTLPTNGRKWSKNHLLVWKLFLASPVHEVCKGHYKIFPFKIVEKNKKI